MVRAGSRLCERKPPRAWTMGQTQPHLRRRAAEHQAGLSPGPGETRAGPGASRCQGSVWPREEVQTGASGAPTRDLGHAAPPAGSAGEAAPRTLRAARAFPQGLHRGAVGPRPQRPRKSRSLLSFSFSHRRGRGPARTEPGGLGWWSPGVRGLCGGLVLSRWYDCTREVTGRTGHPGSGREAQGGQGQQWGLQPLVPQCEAPASRDAAPA